MNTIDDITNRIDFDDDDDDHSYKNLFLFNSSMLRYTCDNECHHHH